MARPWMKEIVAGIIEPDEDHEVLTCLMPRSEISALAASACLGPLSLVSGAYTPCTAVRFQPRSISLLVTVMLPQTYRIITKYQFSFFATIGWNL